MLTNLLWLQSTQMMQWFSPQLKLKQRFWLVFFTQEEDVRTTNHNVIHTYGRGQPRRQPPGGLARSRRGRGRRPSGPPRRGTATRATGAALGGGRRRSTPAARWGGCGGPWRRRRRVLRAGAAAGEEEAARVPSSARGSPGGCSVGEAATASTGGGGLSAPLRVRGRPPVWRTRGAAPRAEGAAAPAIRLRWAWPAR